MWKKKKKKKENGGKDGKALYKLMNNDVHVKTMKMLCMWRLKKVTNRRDIKVVSNTKTTWNGLQNQAACHKKYWTLI